MDPVLRTAVVVVHAALLAYTVGVVLEQRGRRATRAVVSWLTVGVVCDVLATAGMIVGSARGLLTLHGVLGYSALVGMTVDTARMWRHRLSRGEEAVPRALHLFSRFAYLWWVVAYVTGAALVMLERSR